MYMIYYVYYFGDVLTDDGCEEVKSISRRGGWAAAAAR